MFVISAYQFVRFEEQITMLKCFKLFCDDESGATAIEYGLIAALVSIAAIGAMTSLGSSVNNLFTTVSNTMNTAVAG